MRNIIADSPAVLNLVKEGNALLDKAGQRLRTITFEAFASALSLAEGANAKAASAAQLAREEREKQKRIRTATRCAMAYSVFGLMWGLLSPDQTR